MNFIISAPTKAELNDAFAVLCKPSASWSASPHGIYTLIPYQLISKGKFLIHWMKNRFSPTTHYYIVSCERIMIAYFLHKAIKFNVGELLSKELMLIHEKTNRPFVFSLVS